MTKKEKSYLIAKSHEAEQIIGWLANHPAPTDSEAKQLTKMSIFLEILRERFQDIETQD